jgi:hypothetical protein
MAITTYAELKTAVAKWSWNTGETEFEASVGDFVTLAEARFNRELRVAAMEASATITLIDSAGSLPADYLEFRRVVANTSPTLDLQLVTPDFATGEYGTTYSGYPAHFSIIGSTITVYPSTSATVGLRYYQKIPALSDSNTTNWLLTACVEGADFMRDQEQIAKFEARYQAAVKALEGSDTGARYARATMRVSGPTP